MAVRRLPNLLVLGAAKSGTSFVHGELARHPDVYMSPLKEPSFFSDSFQVVRRPTDYARLFAPATDQRWLGESSHLYLTHPESLDAIEVFLDPERFIVILRDPVERAHAQFLQNRRLGHEPCRSLESALRREERRVTSRWLRRSAVRSHTNLSYVHSGMYSRQLDRYFERFGRHRFLVGFYDDLAADPLGFMGTVFEFLDLDPLDHVGQAANVGGTKPRYFPLNLALAVAADTALRTRRLTRWAKLVNLQHRWLVPAAPLEISTERVLRERFADDAIALEALLGRPVPWKDR